MKAVKGGLHHRRDFCLEASCVFAFWLSSSKGTARIPYPGIPSCCNTSGEVDRNEMFGQSLTGHDVSAYQVSR